MGTFGVKGPLYKNFCPSTLVLPRPSWEFSLGALHRLRYPIAVARSSCYMGRYKSVCYDNPMTAIGHYGGTGRFLRVVGVQYCGSVLEYLDWHSSHKGIEMYFGRG